MNPSKTRNAAEFMLMQGILGMRKASLSHDDMRRGGWRKKKGGRRSFYGCTVGLIGYGEIAKLLIPYLVEFACCIKVHSAHYPDGHNYTMAEALDADVIYVLRALNDKTQGSVGRREIESLKPCTVFVNSARAGIVDNAALLERLQKGDIFACLDVFDTEPLPADSPFRSLPNVFLTSHIAGSTEEIRK